MNKHLTVIGCILFCLTISFPIVSCASSISKPTFTLPPNWYLDSETPYPDDYGEYDPEGAGSLTYTDGEDFDFVMIWYEKAPAGTLTASALETKAMMMYATYHDDKPLDDTGTITIGDVPAGYAVGYIPEAECRALMLAFVINDVFLSAYAYYDFTTFEDEEQVLALLDSISFEESNGIPWFLIVIPIIIAVAVIIVVVIFLLKRRKKPVEPTPEKPSPVTPAPEPIAESRFCMECGNRMPPKGFYCNNCGSSPRNFGGPKTKSCHCGTVIPGTAKFCSACGAKQAPT